MAKKKKKAKRKGAPPKGVTPPQLRPFLFKKGGGRRGGSKRGGSVARGGRKRQGVVSWLRSIIALFIALFRPVQLLFAGDVATFQHEASMGLSSGAFDKAAAMTFYGPMVAGLLFHVISGELTRRVKVQSIVPALPG